MNPDDIDSSIEETRELFGVFDALINNDGVNLAEPPLEQTVEQIDMMIGVNPWDLFLLSQRFVITVRPSSADRGQIDKVVRVIGHFGIPQMAAFGASKSGVYGLSRNHLAEFAADSVTSGLVGVDRFGNLVDRKGYENYDLDRFPPDRLGAYSDVANA